MIFKEYFRNRRLRKDESGIRTEFLPLDKIGSMTVLISAETVGAQDCAANVKKFCEGKNILLRLMYSDFRKPSDSLQMPTDPDMTILRKDLNWFGKPNPKKTGDFLTAPVDLFICICDSEPFCIKYISSSIKAKFKIGLREYDGDPYNFIVNAATGSDSLTDAEAVFEKIGELLGTVRLSASRSGHAV